MIMIKLKTRRNNLMRAYVVLALLALCSLLPPPAAAFSCLDASGAPVDWFAAVKYPGSNVNPGNFYTAVFSTNPGAWANRR